MSLFRPLGWRILLTLFLLLLLLAYSAWSNTRTADAQSSADPLVLAFYYPWYDESTWTSGRTSDAPAQPYVSSERSAMARHIEQAQAAGIDAFVVAWYGPGGGNPTEANLAALLEEAAARNFRIAILLETNSPFLGGSGDVTAALQHALSVHAAQPAFLRVDGKPVLFFWRTGMYDAGAWQAIRSQADPENASLWIADGTDTSYLQTFDGHHLYSNTWNPPADLGSVNSKFADQVADFRAQSGFARYWVATAMPGYDDVRARGGFAQAREGGAYYDRSWAAALASAPNWVVITSFNEWMEGSQIEPNATYGDQYLNQTARWSAQFKAGGGAAAAPPSASTGEDTVLASGATDADNAAHSGEAVQIDDAARAAEDVARASNAAPNGPSLTVTAPLLNIRGGPDADFALLATAPLGEVLPIVGAQATTPGWWQVEYQGVTGWVSGEWGTTQGDLASVPQVGAEPLSGANAPAESIAPAVAISSAATIAPAVTVALSPTAPLFEAAQITGGVQVSVSAALALEAEVPAAERTAPVFESARPRTRGPWLSQRP